MENIELKHLAPYLPYGLKMRLQTNSAVEIKTDLLNGYMLFLKDLLEGRARIILKPLYKVIPIIEKEFEKFHNGKEYEEDVIEYFCEEVGVDLSDFEEMKSEYLTYGAIKWLCKNRYDVFGLIEKGLAEEDKTI
jgi:hypothetical protein